MSTIYNQNKYLIYIVLIILFYSYFYNLGGDLSYLKGNGDFGDEGYWLQNPISKIKFDSFLIDDQSQSFFGAPIFNYFTFLFLKYFGISFFNARLISIIFLLLTCYVLFKILLKFDINTYSAIVISISFALLYDNRINYQWSTPIPIEIFFQSIFIYQVMFHKLINYKNITKLIVLFILCYNSKATSVFLFPFTISIIILDNLKNFSWLKKSIYFIFPLLIFFFLRDFLFDYFYHNEYKSFKSFLLTTVSFDFKKVILNLNPYFFIISSIQTFKFPNSTLIFTVIAFTTVKNLRQIFNLNKLKLFISNNRALFILVFYIIFYIFYLYVINSYGYDRRQINLILPFYLLFIILLPKVNLSKHLPLFLFFFISLYSIQAILLFRYLQFDSETTDLKVFVYFFVFAILIISSTAIYYKSSNYLFLIFIVTNLCFHLLFNRNTETLRIANHTIAENNYDDFVITGVNAHHLSIENNFTPIWWLDTEIHTTYPNWNGNYLFFKKNKITVVSSDANNNLSNGYFHHIPKDFYPLISDTVFLYPKFDNNGYLDTNFIKYYKYKK